jgi:hypothetical protein
MPKLNISKLQCTKYTAYKIPKLQNSKSVSSQVQNCQWSHNSHFYSLLAYQVRLGRVRSSVSGPNPLFFGCRPKFSSRKRVWIRPAYVHIYSIGEYLEAHRHLRGKSTPGGLVHLRGTALLYLRDTTTPTRYRYIYEEHLHQWATAVPSTYSQSCWSRFGSQILLPYLGDFHH